MVREMRSLPRSIWVGTMPLVVGRCYRLATVPSTASVSTWAGRGWRPMRAGQWRMQIAGLEQCRENSVYWRLFVEGI